MTLVVFLQDNTRILSRIHDSVTTVSKDSTDETDVKVVTEKGLKKRRELSVSPDRLLRDVEESVTIE